MSRYIVIAFDDDEISDEAMEENATLLADACACANIGAPQVFRLESDQGPFHLAAVNQLDALLEQEEVEVL